MFSLDNQRGTKEVSVAEEDTPTALHFVSTRRKMGAPRGMSRTNWLLHNIVELSGTI